MKRFWVLTFSLFLLCMYYTADAIAHYDLIPSWIQQKFFIGDYGKAEFKKCSEQLQMKNERGLCGPFPKAQEIHAVEYKGDKIFAVDEGCCDQYTILFSKDGQELSRSGGDSGKTTSVEGFDPTKLGKSSLIWKFDPKQDKKYFKEFLEDQNKKHLNY